ncbi:hypothetical protein ACHWQZ_G000926 [Mnemiopsis leidyi]
MSYDCKVDLEGINNTHLSPNRETILNTGGYIIDPLPSGPKDDIISSGPSSASSSAPSISSESLSHLATLHEAEFTKDGAIIVAPIKPEENEQKKSVKNRLRTAWDCCKHTYYATLCALLILVGCPMAAVGSQESVDWALYMGIVMVLCAFLISLLAPNVRAFIECAYPNRLRDHARGLSIQSIRSKMRVKSTSLPT